MKDEEFYKGYQEGIKQELKKAGLFKTLNRLVKEAADYFDSGDAPSSTARQEERIQDKIRQISPGLKAMGFTEEQIRQQAINALNRDTKRSSVTGTRDYFGTQKDDNGIPKTQKKLVLTQGQEARLKTSLKELNNDALETFCKKVYKEFVLDNIKSAEPKDNETILNEMHDKLQSMLNNFTEEGSLFGSLIAEVSILSAEDRVRSLFNFMQVVLEIATRGEVSQQRIAGVINEFRKPYKDHIKRYIQFLQEEYKEKIMNSVFRTHSDFNPAHNQRGTGGSLFSWMDRVNALAKEIKADIAKNGEISNQSLNKLIDIKEQGIEFIIKYASFREKEEESSKKNRFRFKEKIDPETGRKILPKNSQGQIVIGSGSKPFYPSFIEFFLRGTIKAAAGEKETLVDKILLISEATIPLNPEEERTDDKVFTQMRKIAARFYQNRQEFTKFTNVSGAFAGREIPAFYNRIVEAYEKGYSSHGELLEFVTMYAHRLAAKSKEPPDVCGMTYNIDLIIRPIREWTENYQFFIKCTKAQKQAGQAQAMSGQMTNATHFIKQGADLTAGIRQGSYTKNKDIRKRKKS